GLNQALFQALEVNDRIQSILFPSLLGFKSGKRFSVVWKDEIEKNTTPDTDIWLFPNFGKRDGFGEPDALLLFGSLTFWFEVETKISLKGEASVLRDALRQMARFQFFYQALKTGEHPREGPPRHLAIE